MPTTVQFRRGTTAQNDAFTGAAGELSIDTNKNSIRVHDNSTAGGIEIANVSATQTLTNKTLTAPNLTSPTISGIAIAEYISDTVGAMVSSNTESGISVTYQDADNTLDFDVGDFTITLGGDLTGSATITNLGSATLTATIIDDSHNHIISNVDGLQTALDAKLALAGGTMSGNIAMGSNSITGLADPSSNQDAATKAYVDSGLSSLSSTTLTEGNSTLVVADSGTGTITATIDGATHSTFAAAGITLAQGEFIGDVTGNADTADAWSTARTLSLTGAVTGSASIDGSGNVSLATTATSDPVITLTGAVTGSGTMTNLGNVSIATTATADPTLTLSGDASGSATFTNLGNATLTVTVADDSHNHIIGNVDGLQTALDAKLALAGGTMSGNIAMGTNAITGMADPSSAQDAATKAYVDSGLSSLSSTTLTEGNTTIVVADSGTGTVTVTVDGSTHSTFAAAGITLAQGAFVGDVTGDVTGNADTATALETARTIAGNSFDGTANITIASTQLSDTADLARLAAPAFTGTATGVNLTLSGDLTVNGTTTTLATTNTVISDNLIELNNGAGSNANDSGIVIERGSTGDNAFMGWDESADKFIVGTTTATGASTGNLTISSGTLVANTFEGALSGNATTATALATGRTISLTGDVTGTSGSFDGSGNVSISATIAANSVALGTDTTGNYVGTITGGTGISSSGATTGEGVAHTLSIDSTVATLTGSQTLTNKTLTSPVISTISNTGTLTLPTSTGTVALTSDIPTNNNQLTNGAGYTTNTGDITGVTAGTGLSGGGSSGSVTLNVDLSELTDMTAGMVGTDEFIVLDASADRRKAANEIGLSIFSNDAGFTTNTGDITNVSVSGNGLSGGGASGSVTITSNATNSNSGSTIVFRDGSGNFSAGVITATTTAARYADLAERYTADADYEPGTVLVFGGEAEVTQCTSKYDKRIAGIVSTDPAFLMNESLEDGVSVGLVGRLPCKVVGEVRKGDLMVSSDTAGHAEAWRDESNPPAGSVIGKALENKTGAGADVIEVVVGKI